VGVGLVRMAFTVRWGDVHAMTPKDVSTFANGKQTKREPRWVFSSLLNHDGSLGNNDAPPPRGHAAASRENLETSNCQHVFYFWRDPSLAVLHIFSRH
jgi:hypothetical protein